MTVPDSEPCAALQARIAELEAQIAELQEQCAGLESRLQFRVCGQDGAVLAEVAMPGGALRTGHLCRAHIVLLSSTPFAPRPVTGFGGQSGRCGWMVPAEEALAADSVEMEEVTG